MRFGADHVRVRVPATSANLGPGFDSVGLALAHYDDIDIVALGSDQSVVSVVGEGEGSVPTDSSHLVIRALHAALECVGAPLVGVQLTCRNRIPHGRGMGSSAAAVIAGIAAARQLIAEPDALDTATMLALATEFEGHPDNAAPALLGGATVAWMDDGQRPAAMSVRVHADLQPLIAVPTIQLATSSARGVLPQLVPHRDAAFNAGRAALLIAALYSGGDHLMAATEDRLHQPYRREVLAHSMRLVDALRSAGMPAVISGAGPSVLAWMTAGTDTQKILDACADELTGWTLLRPGIDTQGVRSARLSPT